MLQVDLCPSLSRSSVKPVLQSKWFVHISSESSKYSVEIFGLQIETVFQHFFGANCALCYLQGQRLATLCIAYMNTAVPIADTSLPVSDISPNATLSTASSGWPPSTLMAPLVPADDWSLPVSGAWVKHCHPNSTLGAVNIALKYFGFNTKIHYLIFSIFFQWFRFFMFGGELLKKIFA